MVADTPRFGFPLTRRQRDTDQGIELSFWLVNESESHEVKITQHEAIFFAHLDDLPIITEQLNDLPSWRAEPLDLTSFEGKPVLGLYFARLSSYFEAISRLESCGISMMEEDIRPVDRFMMERNIRTGARVITSPTKIADLRPVDYTPTLRACSIDIETTLTDQSLLSLAMQQGDQERVLIKGQGPQLPWIESCSDERALLIRFQELLKSWDPDLLIGWNFIGFDLRVLAKRAKKLGVPLCLGRDQQPIQVEQGNTGRWFARISGRVALDGIETLKGATWQFDSFSLESVSQQLLGRGKKIDQPQDRGEEIQRLYREDRMALAVYNLEDCRLVSEIFEKAELLEYLIERTRLTGLPIDKVGGSQQAFDNLYLPRLHRAGYVAPRYASGRDDLEVPGGFVMDSQPGLYRNVWVFDFKSLYPSLIRTFSIDPLGLVTADQAEKATLAPGFFGAQFNKDTAILPKIIDELWQARDKAKTQGNAALSQAIKIQMNACYGVLGSRVCRFFDQRLSGSITLRGHELLNLTAQEIERRYGFSVIYGDTDSVFVWLGDQFDAEAEQLTGEQIAEEINEWLGAMLAERFGVKSALELQFEAEYSRFLMPRMRHSEKGSKKRYAGLKQERKETRLIFRGLESVRSDWTEEAKQVQYQLYQRVFNDEPWIEYLKEEVAAVYRGERDPLLLYQRKLSRPLEAYQSAAPQVRAARKLQNYLRKRGQTIELSRGDRVEYWITLNGPEPSICSSSTIDYAHYIEKQIKPVADSLLPFLGTSFDQVIAPQADLFSGEQRDTGVDE